MKRPTFKFVFIVIALLPALTFAAPNGGADLSHGRSGELSPGIVLAVANTGGDSAYASCMNGCWRSHRYCKAHQSGQMDCDHQLGQCIEWCESQHDPQSRGPALRIPAVPSRSMVR